MKKFLYWLPRVIGIGVIIFYSLFALDVFDGESNLGEMLLGFLIHMIPAFILIAVLLVAWKWELLGGILYLATGTFYIYMTRGMYWMVYLYIGGPLFLSGILFMLYHFLFRKKQVI
ncbi:MAG: hypothetical protein GYA18_05525 [Chloroflexi bacterium]|nr:hypothetical protein [Chloroflexota bacterium]